jgi:hypothetical protein
MSQIALFLCIALVVTLLRLFMDVAMCVERPGKTKETRPYTTAEIAEEGRMRAAQTDVSYIYYNSQVRSRGRSLLARPPSEPDEPSEGETGGR